MIVSRDYPNWPPGWLDAGSYVCRTQPQLSNQTPLLICRGRGPEEFVDVVYEALQLAALSTSAEEPA